MRPLSKTLVVKTVLGETTSVHIDLVFEKP